MRRQQYTMGTVSAAMASMIVVMCVVLSPSWANARPRPVRFTRPSGGLVERAVPGKVVRVINAQGTLSREVVEAAARGVRLRSLLPIVVETGRTSATEAAWRTAASAAVDAGAAVLIADNTSLPLVIASPDAQWAIANVASLQGTSEHTEARLEKLLWNAVARALGTGAAGDGGVIAPFSGITGLDALPDLPGPASHNALMDAAKVQGIGLIRLTTYRTACEEGWAPVPTNDVQKAIWEHVRSEKERGPANALRIVPKAR